MSHVQYYIMSRHTHIYTVSNMKYLNSGIHTPQIV